MKRASSRLFPILAVCGALLGGCESEYDELSQDIKEPGWGEPAPMPMLPSCPDASTSPMDSGRPDSGSPDSGATPDGGLPDAGGDTGAPDAGGSADAAGDADQTG